MTYNSAAGNSSTSISVLSLLAFIICLTLTSGVSAQSKQFGVKATAPNPTALADRSSGNLLEQYGAADSSGSAGNLLPAWTAAAPTSTGALRYGFADDGENFYIIGGLDSGFAKVPTVRRSDRHLDDARPGSVFKRSPERDRFQQ